MRGRSVVSEKSRCWAQVLLKLRNDVTDTMVESIASSSEREKRVEPSIISILNGLGARRDEMR